jgi:hypothetical protein
MLSPAPQAPKQAAKFFDLPEGYLPNGFATPMRGKSPTCRRASF